MKKCDGIKKGLKIGLVGLFAVAMWLNYLPGNAMAKEAATGKQAWNLNEKIHPDLKEAFVSLPERDFTDVQNVRKIFSPDLEKLPKDDQVIVKNEIITGYSGISNLRVRIYKPKIEQHEYPAVLWIHGGGHIMGNPEMYEDLLLRMSRETNSIIVAPDYRLSPENPYPADVNDCYAALNWMIDSQKSKLPIRKDRIAVAGDSAGGGLTMAIALKARDEAGPAICFTMPLYPMLDNSNTTLSSHQITDKRVWNLEANKAAWSMYLQGQSDGDISSYAVPALAQDLSNLPPTYIMIGSLDVFRDEVSDYAQRLLQDGVPVELNIVPGTVHAFERMMPNAEVSQKAQDNYIKVLNQALNK